MRCILQSVDGPRISVRMGSMGSWKWLAPNWPVRTGFAWIAISLFGMYPMILYDLRSFFCFETCLWCQEIASVLPDFNDAVEEGTLQRVLVCGHQLAENPWKHTASKSNKFNLLKPAPSRPVQFPWAFLHWLCCW